MNKKEAKNFLEKCLDQKSIEYLIYFAGNEKLEKAIKILLNKEN